MYNFSDYSIVNSMVMANEFYICSVKVESDQTCVTSLIVVLAKLDVNSKIVLTHLIIVQSSLQNMNIAILSFVCGNLGQTILQYNTIQV